jgi:hypothetical protein
MNMRTSMMTDIMNTNTRASILRDTHTCTGTTPPFMRITTCPTFTIDMRTDQNHDALSAGENKSPFFASAPAAVAD